MEDRVAMAAALQGGQIHREQLRGLGLGGSAIDHRARGRRLHRTTRGVYSVGHRRGDLLARIHAAILAAGDGAALSHWAGGGELGLTAVRSTTQIDVTVPSARRPRPGIRYHRSKLPADEIVFENGLAITSVGRTLFDLAGSTTEFIFRRAVKEVAVQRLHCWPTLPMLLERHPSAPGAALIRAVIDEGSLPPGVVPTDGEERFSAIVQRGGFPPPARHYGVAFPGGWVEVDFAWPDLLLAVECDSSFHENEIALETDHDRDGGLLAAGWIVFRVTWRQLHDDPDRVLRRFRAVYERALRNRRMATTS